MASFYRNIFSLSENIAKRFRGATFLTHTVYSQQRVENKGKKEEKYCAKIPNTLRSYSTQQN